MKNNNTKKSLYSKLAKLETRLLRSLKRGSFFFFNPAKQSQLARRLQVLSTQLKRVVKPAFATAFLALGLSNVKAQTFTAQTGTANPLNGVDLGGKSSTIFIDIDNDGDQDLMSGEFDGGVFFYRNTGTISSPTFIAQTGTNNPFNGVDVGFSAAPVFVDIDNDGDQDAFMGAYSGEVLYFENTGTISASVFVQRTGSSNPFNSIDVGRDSAPSFADIDGDGDMDAFIGERYGEIFYYRNTGTASSAAFAAQTGTNNPFNGVDVGQKSYPTLIDFDNDADFDAFIGESNGTIRYYLNTGTSNSPSFSWQTMAANPLNLIDVGYNSTPAFVDIDNDGDLDFFSGEEYGTFLFYRNSPNVAVVSIAEEIAFSVYPNPAQNFINIEFVDNEAIIETVAVWNNIGQLIFEENINGKNRINISIENWPKGVYFIRLGSKNLTFVKK